jgi:DNA-binding transcriptional regulator YiaG
MGGSQMTYKELREQSGMTRFQFAEYFEIPYRTALKWETGERKCSEYLLKLMEYKLKNEKMI